MLSVVPSPVTVRVPAKVNLHLAVGDVRADGYHELVTLFQSLSLIDEVIIGISDDPGIQVYGDDVHDVPTDRSNLAWRAVQALAEYIGRDPEHLNVRVVINKGIPVAGGMAGGSADAAAVLIGLAALWRLDIGRDELSTLGASIGSDVPFALQGGTALGTGRGEQLIPVLARHTFHWVLALGHEGLSTPDVYRELDKLRLNGDPPRVGGVEPVLEALASGDPCQLALLLGNDLQAAAISLRPSLRRTLRAGVDAGALAGMVSGSGPTCAFLCMDEESAAEVATRLSGEGACHAVRIASGPVPGARIIATDEPPRATPPPVHA